MIFDISTCSGGTLEFPLDPEQPYLAHHDVGTPLLGTVMSLEAMAECAMSRTGKVPRQIFRVLAGEDCLVPGTKSLHCRLTPEQTAVHADLTDAGKPVFSCDFSFEQGTCAGIIGPSPARGADRYIIYDCFFHGPAFQVVEQAWLNGDRMFARCCSHLPALTCGGTKKEVLPVRAMEFCLQTAGLLDAALRRRMSVPRSIGEIRLYNTEDLSGLWACASFGAGGADIHAYNSLGEAVLSVLDYQTRPMPAKGQPFERLCSSFF